MGILDRIAWITVTNWSVRQSAIAFNDILRSVQVTTQPSRIPQRVGWSPPSAHISQLFSAISLINHTTAESEMAATLSAGFPGVMASTSRDCTWDRNARPIRATTSFSPTVQSRRPFYSSIL